MSFTVPVVEAKFTLLPEMSRGRRGLSTGKYRPHIVIGPESQRVAIREGNRLTENYLGVMFVGGPDSMEPGDAANVKLALMYFPEYPYEEVQPGVTFTWTCAASANCSRGIRLSLAAFASTKLPSTDRCWPCTSPTSTHCRTTCSNNCSNSFDS